MFVSMEYQDRKWDQTSDAVAGLLISSMLSWLRHSWREKATTPRPTHSKRLNTIIPKESHINTSSVTSNFPPALW